MSRAEQSRAENPVHRKALETLLGRGGGDRLAEMHFAQMSLRHLGREYSSVYIYISIYKKACTIEQDHIHSRRLGVLPTITRWDAVDRVLGCIVN
jgi:hypothetical protein